MPGTGAPHLSMGDGGNISINSIENQPLVSVVVPVYNGERTIARTIECLFAQSLMAHEIIIVDDGSTDGTESVLKQYRDEIIYLCKENGGPASARNHGIRRATGEFVAFTDSDCLPDEDWLSNLVKGFDHPQVGGVGGTIRRADEGLISEYVDLAGFFNPVIAENDRACLPTGNAAFRRSVLLEAGLFDERFRKPGGEEPELCLKIKLLGYEFRAIDDALVLHHHKQTLRGLLNAISTYGEGEYIRDTLWPQYKWPGDRRKQLYSSLTDVRGLIQRGLAYRSRFGMKRALIFSILEQLRIPVYMWGYFRAKRNGGHRREA
jgi:glycosyltransferase involved in cell wall biosynthesis